MEQLEAYVLVDKKTGELRSYEVDNDIVFSKKKKYILPEKGAEIRKAIIEIKIKGFDY